MTSFEQQVRGAIEVSGIAYSQLAKEANVDAGAVSRFMSGKRGLTSDTLGRILDTLGCTLGPPINRFAPKRVGRPRKIMIVGKLDGSIEDGTLHTRLEEWEIDEDGARPTGRAISTEEEERLTKEGAKKK